MRVNERSLLDYNNYSIVNNHVEQFKHDNELIENELNRLRLVNARHKQARYAATPYGYRLAVAQKTGITNQVTLAKLYGLLDKHSILAKQDIIDIIELDEGFSNIIQKKLGSFANGETLHDKKQKGSEIFGRPEYKATLKQFITNYTASIDVMRYEYFKASSQIIVKNLAIVNEQILNAYESTSMSYYYENGIYKLLPQNEIIKYADDIAERVTPPENRKKIIEARRIAVDDIENCIIKQPSINFEEHEKKKIINFKNGLLSLKNNKTMFGKHTK